MADIIATLLEAKNIGGSATAVDDPKLCVTKLKAINSFNCDIINESTYLDNLLVCKKDLTSKVPDTVTIEYYDASNNNNPLFTLIVSPEGFKLPTTIEILLLLKLNNITSVCSTELYKWIAKSDEKSVSFFAFVQYKDKSIYDSNGSNVYYTSGNTPSSILTGVLKYIVTIQPYIEISVGNSDLFDSLTWEYILDYDPIGILDYNTGYITCLIYAKVDGNTYSTITVKKNTVIKKYTNGTLSTSNVKYFKINTTTYVLGGVSYTPDEKFYLALGNLNQDPETVNYNKCAASEYNPSGISSPACGATFKNITDVLASVTWKIVDNTGSGSTKKLEFLVTLTKYGV